MTRFAGFETGELLRMRDQLVAMRELTDRRRGRLKATPAG